MNKMLICSAIALTGLTAGCGALGHHAPGAESQGQYRDGPSYGRTDVVYVDDGYRDVTYRDASPRYDTYTTTSRSEARWSSPSAPATYSGPVYTQSSGDRWRDRWDGLTLGQRYEMERAQGLAKDHRDYGGTPSGDGRYWDGQNWRLPDGRYWDGESWRR